MPTKSKKTSRTRVTVPAAMRRTIDALGKNWIFRSSNNGVASGGFKWEAVGEWTEAPDWNPEPICGYGLHGQGPGGYGYAHIVENARFEFCQTRGTRVVIDENKIKVRYARILFVGTDAFLALLYATKRNFPGSLYLSGCDLNGITLPTSVGGYLDLSGCDLNGITLPTSVGGYLYLSGCDLNGITLPTSVGGYLYLSGCDLNGITLPTSVGGYLDLRGCKNIPAMLPTTKVFS